MPKQQFHYDEWGVKGSLLVGFAAIGGGIGVITDQFGPWLVIGIGVALVSVALGAICRIK
ncbi:MAG: hypothetical protein ABI397_00540 [Candidatus Saccharimonas sp.]